MAAHCTRSSPAAARGKLNLIDLAGSERVEKSGALDDKKMFDEAKNINLVRAQGYCRWP